MMYRMLTGAHEHLCYSFCLMWITSLRKRHAYYQSLAADTVGSWARVKREDLSLGST